MFCERYGLPYSRDLFYRTMYGPANQVILAEIMPQITSDAERDALSEEKEDIYRDIIIGDPTLQILTAGAPEVLDRLTAMGVPYAIATGSIRSNCEFYMDVLGLDRWFDFDRIFCSDGTLPGKPDPAPYREAMRHLGYAPEDTIVVEDSPAGIQSAVGAGIDTIIALHAEPDGGAYAHIPQVRGVIRDFYGLMPYIDAL